MSKKYKCFHSSNRTITCEMAIPCRDCTFFSPDYLESKLLSALPTNNAMNAISLKAKAFVPKVKNGMDSWTIHNIRDILATVAETAS